ncbi:hypothetical protein L208DRAFT_1416664 [Tricholoma matsutake]|nr:hypothetical protein L208DRAFT_1416664 [Tricholoma matsutake 945]
MPIYTTSISNNSIRTMTLPPFINIIVTQLTSLMAMIRYGRYFRDSYCPKHVLSTSLFHPVYPGAENGLPENCRIRPIL